MKSQALHMEIVARTFKQLWQSTSGFMLWNLGDHKVLFVFDNSTDIDRIIHSDPSSFDKQLVVLEMYDKDILLCDVKFAKANFWVQVHEIPIRFTMTEVAEGLYMRLMGSQTILWSGHWGGWKFYLGSGYYWCVTSPFPKEGGVFRRWREKLGSFQIWMFAKLMLLVWLLEPLWFMDSK